MGPHAPLLNTLIEATAFPVLVAVAVFRTGMAPSRGTVAALLLILLLLAIGIAQLCPLSASTWQALSGHEIPLLVSDMLDEGARPAPLSLSPDDTRMVLQSFLPPVAIFLATLQANDRDRKGLAILVVAVAAFSSILGLLQLSFGDGTLFPYRAPPFDRFPGLFANQNHQATLLACAVALAPALVGRWSDRRSSARVWPVVLWGLLLLGALATASRAGLALFAAASVLAAIRIWRPAGQRGGSRRSAVRRRSLHPIVWALAVLAVLGTIGWLAGGYRTGVIASRYDVVDSDARFEFWRTTLIAIRTYVPYGSGLGTFAAVYQIVEPLDSVRNYLVNHAHNDYLELVLETGIAGVVLMLLFVGWLATRIVDMVRRRHGGERLAWSGATIVALVMLHSLVDYPLRTEAIGCLFAFACGLLVEAPRRAEARGSAAQSQEAMA